jgi:Protein of unknown function (DUF3000)
MSGTYARVMGPTDGPGNRRRARSEAAGRSQAAGPSGAAAGPSGAAAGPSGAAAGPSGAAAGSAAASPQAQRTPARDAGTPAVGTGTAAEATFAAAVAAFRAGRDAQADRDLCFEDVAAPRRLAPYATAMAATVQRDGADVAWGRLVLLFDPDGQEGWDGVFRLVAYVRAEIEPEMAADPLLGEVGWSWLCEALDAHVPGYAVPSGTVTRVITEGFGAKRDELPLTGFELRASWSPAGPEKFNGSGGPKGRRGLTEDSGLGDGELGRLDLSAHIAAWCDCLAAAVGLEPPGTRALRPPGRG